MHIQRPAIKNLPLALMTRTFFGKFTERPDSTVEDMDLILPLII